MAAKSKIDIRGVEWDGGLFNVDREDFHTLKVYTDDSSVKKTFYDEEIVDFPYECGDIIQKIKNVIKELKA